MDAISLYQAGFKNVVATLGTAMTESHLNLVWRYFNDPVVCFDGDRSGQNAAHKISEKLIAYMKPNYSLSFLILPNGFDPDSFAAYSRKNHKTKDFPTNHLRKPCKYPAESVCFY